MYKIKKKKNAYKIIAIMFILFQLISIKTYQKMCVDIVKNLNTGQCKKKVVKIQTLLF